MNDILIVVDVQNDFTTGALGSEEAAAKVAAIEAYARDFILLQRHQPVLRGGGRGKVGAPIVQHCMFWMNAAQCLQ